MLSLALLSLTFSPYLSAQECGDCNLDTAVSILDALCAAQVQIGLKLPLTGQALINCNVDDQGGVTIIDALLIAQCAVGLRGAPCGLACSGLRIEVTAPIGVQSGVILISYKIFDDNSDPVDVTASFSTDQGASWRSATNGAGGDPLIGRPSAPSPIGVASTFSWNTSADGIGRGCPQPALLRLAPMDAGGPGLSGISSAIQIENSSAAFAPGPTMPGGVTLQEQAQVLLSDGRVLMVGGTINQSMPTASAFVHDPSTGVTAATAPMNVPRIGCMLVALSSGNAVVFGGFSSLSPLVFESTVEYFIGATNSFVNSPVPMPMAAAQATAVFFRARNEILITGGLHDGGGGDPVITTDAIRYTPNAMSPAASVGDYYNASRFARYEHTATLIPGADGVVGTADDLALIYGGSGQDPASPPTMPIPPGSLVHSLHVLGDAEVFDPRVGFGRWHQVNDNVYYKDQQQFDAGASDIGPRRQHAAVLLLDGSVLIVGGHAEIDPDPSTGALARIPVDDRLRFAERFFLDPISPSLSAIDPEGMHANLRVAPQATRMRCGDVLITGGYDFALPLQPVIAMTEIYDPLAAPGLEFRPSGTLIDARWLHGATLTLENEVFIAGGEGGNTMTSFTLATTEIYTP